ncbi:MAG: aminotransferase class III-fold pyridoxal phosphate-dependent enzyme [Chloroflexi bacterium]|nr:aminotransferase class III-fold pyridoxal phosphate-dependent enzyme [Chloroflexota bacterium]
MATLKRVPHLSLNWHPAGDLVIARAEGCEMFDSDGRAYLDFMAGIGVVNTGHCHPTVVTALEQQARCLLHSQSYIALHPPILELAQKLAEVTPAAIDTFFFCSSGSEAVEAGLRLARSATGRPNIIAFQGGFHGRTAGAMSLTTSNATYRSGALPFIPGIYFAPFPRQFRHRISEAEATTRSLQAINELLQTQTRPEHTAAIVIEPVQGEGGIVPAPAAFLQGLRELCDTHGILLISDEIQAGFGRTGRMFAIEHAGVEPDIILMGKGMASGLPLAAIGAPEAIMDKAPYGSQGGTYNGNALACAAAVATLEAFDADGLVKQAADNGAYLLQKLVSVTDHFSSFNIDVRGKGLMVAVELLRADGSAAGSEVEAVIARCRAQGLLLLSCGPASNIIRMTPPLVVTQEQIDTAVAILAAALDGVLAS